MSTTPLCLWSKDAIRSAIVEVVKQIQEMGGNAVPEFDDSLVLMEGVESFDSLRGVEALVMLSEQFGAELPNDLFHDPKTGACLTLAQAVDRTYEFLNRSGGSEAEAVDKE